MKGECYVCGDGVECISGVWVHIDDSIGLDGRTVVSACEWGNPVGVLPVEDDEQSQRLGGITW
jgi:hypothetical protein